MNLSLYVVFNRKCNLNCSFCYQNPTGIKTGEGTEVDKLLKFQNFLERQPRINKLTILGGEALLEEQLIRNFLDFVRNLNTRRDDKLSVSFMTNGTVYLPWMKDYRDVVSYFQISLDGGPSAQNFYRKFSETGKGSYEIVLENIRKYTEDKLPVYCHGVVSWDTRKVFKESFEQLMKDLPEKVVYNVELVHDHDKSLFKPAYLLHMVYSLYKKYPPHRFAVTRHAEPPRVQSGNFCTAGTSFLGFDINSGKFYGCHEKIGSEGDYVGDINLSAPIDGDKIEKFVQRRICTNYRIQGLPKKISHVILRSFPIYVCPTENEEITGDYFLIPLKSLIIYFYGITFGKKYIRTKESNKNASVY